MTDFTKILDKAKELEAKMKESQEKIKKHSGRRNVWFKFCKGYFKW